MCPYVKENIHVISELFPKVSLVVSLTILRTTDLDEVIYIFLWDIDIRPPSVPLGTIIQLI